jgi:hypothetical protein
VTKQIFGFLLVFLIILGAFVFCERFFSPSFKQCVADHQSQESSGYPKENPSGFLSPISTYVECTGDFIEKNNGAITALATIITPLSPRLSGARRPRKPICLVKHL